MIATVEFCDGFMRVTVNGETHAACEVRFGFDGQIPTMDLGGIPLGEIEQDEPRAKPRSMDDG